MFVVTKTEIIDWTKREKKQDNGVECVNSYCKQSLCHTSVKSNGDSFLRRLDFSAVIGWLRFGVSVYVYEGILLANQSTVESPFHFTDVFVMPTNISQFIPGLTNMLLFQKKLIYIIGSVFCVYILPNFLPLLDSDEHFYRAYFWALNQSRAERRHRILTELEQSLNSSHFSPCRQCRCAVVFSSGEMTGSSAGESIDSHDFVIRFNDAPVAGKYKRDVGAKTTHRVLGTTGAEKLIKYRHRRRFHIGGELLVFMQTLPQLPDKLSEKFRAGQVLVVGRPFFDSFMRQLVFHPQFQMFAHFYDSRRPRTLNYTATTGQPKLSE